MPGPGRRIEKGQVLNPTGRPKKGTSMTELMRKIAEEEMEINGKKMTKGEFIAAKVFAMAAQGDMSAVKLWVDRIDGQAKQAVEVSGPQGGPVESSVRVEFLAPGTLAAEAAQEQPEE